MSEPSQLDSFVTLLSNDDKRASQPPDISTRMKPHQLTMLNACLNVENDKINSQTNLSSRVGIICDLVGSGKSLSALSIVAS